MKKTATLIEINVYERMVPLVAGYLEAFARSDSYLDNNYSFRKYRTTRTTPFDTLIDDLNGFDSDIYAFSCYIWNMGLIKSLLPMLLDSKPNAQIMLGGPQVMHHARDYLDPKHENVTICNGEGEQTFSNYLRELSDTSPDLFKVNGLSFYREGELVTTAPEPRIKQLDDIPSPFLNGLFESANNMSVIETTRGCPFRCGFCYWGAANNDRVYKFSEERIREELNWICRNSTPTILFADANWGMLTRDITLSEYIAECREQYFAPQVVHFSAAKNSPARVAAITKIFKKAGLFSPQPISMQSLDETALEQVERSNIKLAAYESLQDDLNQADIGSYIELIWPLPGETLASFKEGVSSLCERRAHTIVIYIHLLLHNTPLYARRNELGIVTRRSKDGLAEADIVIQTADVSGREFELGMWFIYAVKVLYNTRILNALGRYLHFTCDTSYGELFSKFVDHCIAEEQHPYSVFCRDSIAEARYYDITNYPTGYYIALHSDRMAFNELLYDFATSQSWWSDENARALFEIDQLTKPFLYSNTDFGVPNIPFEHVRVLNESDRCFDVEIPSRIVNLLAKTCDENTVFRQGSTNGRPATSGVYRIDHNRKQFRHDPRQSAEARADYCSGVIARLSNVLPLWSQIERKVDTGSTH